MASFLIIDEDRNFREALAIALRLDGHEAAVAATPEDARTRLAAERFTCCVVDAHIFGADVLLEAVVSSGALAVATGPYVELLDATASRHPGAATLPKPFRAFELTRVVFAARARAAG